MDLLSDRQVDQINDILIQQGVEYRELRYDLLDHVCCMVEDGLEQGEKFSISLENALQSFGIENFKLIQESTMYLLNQKLNKMKKAISIVGLIASLMVISGVFFKVNHLMGASILLIMGVSLVSLVVLPLLSYATLIAKEDGQTTITSIVGYFAAMSLSMGGMFKLMHWPYANMLFWMGVAILLLGFIPMYTIRSYRLAENKLFALTKSALIIAGVSLLWSLSANRKVFNVEVPGGALNKVESVKN